eukprot:844916-Rhodomonas_salina.1
MKKTRRSSEPCFTSTSPRRHLTPAHVCQHTTAHPRPMSVSILPLIPGPCLSVYCRSSPAHVCQHTTAYPRPMSVSIPPLIPGPCLSVYYRSSPAHVCQCTTAHPRP